MNYYSSDLHLFHERVIQYSNRPFGNVEEMNRTIIDRINQTVGPNDTLYLLGDISFSRADKALPLLLEIVCQNIHLIEGNHDRKDMKTLRRPNGQPFWKSVSPLKEIKDQNRHVVLCHYKMTAFNRSHHGAFQLYGHSHGTLPGSRQQTDVGVDCWDFYPVTLDQAIVRMASWDDTVVQHH